jgi:pre-mRNA-processing factor 6
MQEQFADVKRTLATVTDDEWANIPEVGDITGKNKRRQNLRERTYAVGDSVLLGMINSTQFNQSVDANEDGTATSLGGTQTDFVEMGAARDRLLASSLENARGGGNGLRAGINEHRSKGVHDLASNTINSSNSPNGGYKTCSTITRKCR